MTRILLAGRADHRLGLLASLITGGEGEPPLLARPWPCSCCSAGSPSQRRPQGQASRHQAKTLRFDVRFSPFHLVDADGDGATSLGDYAVFHDILLRNGEEVGDEGGTCPIVDVEQGLIHCTGTIRLAEGQLTFQGLTTTAATKHIAITGGTGRYQGVGGEATLVELGDGTGT
jgi:allene oxide cyclase-like protein